MPRPQPLSPITPPAASDAWRFSVFSPAAESVWLVSEDAGGLTEWLPMQPARAEAGHWALTLPAERLGETLGYYTVEGGAVIRCGAWGLSATRAAVDHAKAA